MENSMSFGTVIGAPTQDRPPGKAFRIAILGDFSGRANRGELDGADGIADRKPIKIDFDSIDEVIEELAPKLRIPIVGGRSFIELEFSELDAFDADELFDRVPLLDDVQGLGRRVERSVEKAVALANKWASAELPCPGGTSRAVAIPNVDSLADFQSLTGEATVPEDATQLEAGELLEAFGAPFMKQPAAAEKPYKEVLLRAAAEATNAAARQFMHHPDFQALEGAWREVDWLLRRVDKGGRVKVVLFDVSAEEFAADLSTDGELQETGLYRLLVDKTAEGPGGEPWSLVLGRYEFDYSRPHAELLGRIGKICERLNAPFLSGISSRLLDEGFKNKDEELIACWNEMRALPSSSSVGLALPGFLLRLPYGKNGKTTDRFDYEEFDPANSPGCLLWGNAGVFCGALLAGAYLKEAKWEFDPNQHRVLDKLPVFVNRVADDDAVTMTTEKRFGVSVTETVMSLGLIPLQAVKDRDSVQVPQLRSLSATNAFLRGSWAATAPAAPGVPAASTSSPEPAGSANSGTATLPGGAGGSSDFSAGADSGGLDPELAALLGDSSAGGAGDSSTSDSGLDPELAALLGESSPTGTGDSLNSDSGLDPELAALLGESSPTGTGDSSNSDSGLDPELAALLGESSGGSTDDKKDDDDIDPELAKLLGG